MDRRSFLKGLSLTLAGLLVPKELELIIEPPPPLIFDIGANSRLYRPSLSELVTITARARSKELKEAIMANNVLLKELYKYGAITRCTGGRLLRG